MPPSPATISATKTAVFCARDVSAWKRAAVLDAMKRTHLATAEVVEALLADFPSIQALVRKTDRKSHMQHIAYRALASWALPGSGAAAARVDALGMVESYLQTLSDGRATASPPTVPSLSAAVFNGQYEAALSDLAETHGTYETEGLARDAMNRATSGPRLRPLSLHGYGHFFRLLRHPETKRLFAWVNLLSQDSRFAPSQKEANNRATSFDGHMVDIATGERVLCKRPTWVLFPLAHGFDYQDRQFMLAGEPGGGRLVYRPEMDRFELHVSFEFRAQEIKPALFIGIDRGIHKLVAWSVVDADGRVIEDGDIDGLQLRHVQRVIERRTKEAQQRGRQPTGSQKRAYADEAVHVAANAIIEVTKRHGARVVLEQLNIQRRVAAVPKGNRGGASGRNLRKILGRQQYAKLVRVLAYKLRLEGLPPPLEVGAAGTSITCPECVRRDKANRPEQARFRCVACGHEANADRNAARIIAIKGAWLLQVPARKQRGGRPLTEEEKFDSFLKRTIEKRGVAAGKPAHTFVAPDLGHAACPSVRMA